MNPFVTTPHWGGWIIAYFFLGGIAAGAYAVRSLADLFGTESDRHTVRVASYLAFPLVSICGLILIVDLNRPERFWHMLIQSETFRPMLKGWSPMSAGSWGLSVFGALSFASFGVALAEDRGFRSRFFQGMHTGSGLRIARGLYDLVGTASAFFLGSYTGALLSASNQPVWAQTTWLAPLFLASSASTGIAAILLLIHWRRIDVPPEGVERLEWLDTLAVVLEIVLLAAFTFSLSPAIGRSLGRWPGVLIPSFVVPVGLIFPLGCRFLSRPWGSVLSPLAVLAGGLVLRIAVVGMPSSLVLVASNTH
ncbi:MAG: polysulfide reductase NrfD [Isosphaeraceae bacterium]